MQLGLGRPRLKARPSLVDLLVRARGHQLPVNEAAASSTPPHKVSAATSPTGPPPDNELPAILLLNQQAPTIPLPPTPSPYLSPPTIFSDDPTPESPLRIIPTVLITSESPPAAQPAPAPAAEPPRPTPTSTPAAPSRVKMAPVSFEAPTVAWVCLGLDN